MALRAAFFRDDYLQWLKNFRYDPTQVQIRNDGGKLDIRLSGPWREVIMWEVPLLAVISELVHRYRSPEASVDQALAHLEVKLDDFRAMTDGLDLSAFRLMDFGTRRRFSRDVQQAIVERLKLEPWFIGTSNYDLARRLSLTPMGTQAHEWFQAHQQISPDLANSQIAALQAWLDEYPDMLGIALTDCITMDAFLRDFGPEFAGRYQGCATTREIRCSGARKLSRTTSSLASIRSAKRLSSLITSISRKRLSSIATSRTA